MKPFIFLCFGFLLCFSEVMAQTFQIDSNDSEIRILLYKEGTLSGFAHNHVIVGEQVTGQIQLSKEVTQSTFELKVPVETLIVDRPEHRKQEGVGFESELSESDINDIRKTMLSYSVIDAEQFPEAAVRSVQVSGTLPNLELKALFTIHGVSQEFTLPVEVTLEGDTLTAIGQVELWQSAFDIRPISLFLGTIKVKDQFLGKFHIVARSKS